MAAPFTLLHSTTSYCAQRILRRSSGSTSMC